VDKTHLHGQTVQAALDEKETSGHRSSPTKVRCDPSTNILVKPFSFTIAYVDLDIAGKRVAENNTELFSWHWPGDDELIFSILTSIVDMTILSIVNAAITGLPDHSWNIRKFWGCLKEPNGDGGPFGRNFTSIFDNNTAAGWVKEAMKLSNSTLFCVVYCGQHADGPAGAQMPMRGGPSYLPLNDILPPPAEDMIDDIGEDMDDDGEMRRPNPRTISMTKPGFQKFDWNLEKRMIR